MGKSWNEENCISRCVWPASKYEIHPQILQTCRQVSVEASNILYGSNNFAFDISDMSCPLFMPLDEKKTLARYATKAEFFQDQFRQAAVQKVRRWVVYLNTGFEGRGVASRLTNSDGMPLTHEVYPLQFDFCRSLNSSQLSSVTLVTTWASLARLQKFPFTSPSELIPEPFHILRNVGKLDIQTWTGESVFAPDLFDDDTSLIKQATVLKDLMEGGSPQDDPIEMLDSLLAYVRCFERVYTSGFTKNPADTTWGEHSSEERHFRDAYMLPLLGFEIIKAQPQGFVWSDTKYSKTEGPFQQFQHPVEVACSIAQIAATEHNISVFKEKRVIVLGYLEPQYQRIMKAYWALTEFVKTEKVPAGLLDVNIHLPKYNIYSTKQECENKPKVAAFRNDLGTGLLLLDDFREALKRDAPLQVKAGMRLNQEPFDRAYNSLPFETRLRILSELVARLSAESAAMYTTCRDIENVFILLRETIQEAENIYQDIRTTRKLLFSCDHTKIPGYELDLEEWRSDDRIHWSASEPYIGMQKFHRVSLDEDGLETDYEYPYFWAGWNVDWVAPPGFEPHSEDTYAESQLSDLDVEENGLGS